MIQCDMPECDRPARSFIPRSYDETARAPYYYCAECRGDFPMFCQEVFVEFDPEEWEEDILIEKPQDIA